MWKPPVGAVVTLTTRYRNDCILFDSEFQDNVYKNVTVLEPEPWMKSDEIKITSDTQRMPFRVIKVNRIISVSNDIGYAPTKQDFKDYPIKGSKGSEYTVRVKDGVAIACTCPGYTFRHRCRHLKEVQGMLS